MRAKLEEWKVMVGRPRHQPAVIGRTQALTGAHGPTTLPAIPERGIAGIQTCFAGAQHLGGGVLSRSVPNAKSTLVAHTWAPSPSPHRPPSGLLRPVQPHGPVLIMPDWTHWTRSPNPQWTACQINPPHLRGDGSLPRSRGHHVTIVQPHVTRTTSSVPVDLGPEGPNPCSFHSISILSNANASLIALQSPPAPLCPFPIQTPFVCAPVPCSHPCLPLLHADSRPSHRGAPDLVPIAYLCLRPCGSISYK